MSRARQHRQSAEVRARILDTAKRIVAEEGVEALSIRRITKEMDYSAGIVYHYFKSKEEILSCVLQEGYAEILHAVRQPDENLPPDEAIRASIANYMESASKSPFIYKAIMLDSSPQVLAFTSVLTEHACEKSPALSSIASTLEAGIADGIFAPCDTQLTAQIIWSAAFGLLIRILIEGDISSEQQAKLTEHQISFILKGLSA